MNAICNATLETIEVASKVQMLTSTNDAIAAGAKIFRFPFLSLSTVEH